MQLISCAPHLRIDIRPGRTNYTPKGDVTSEDPALFVQFHPGGAVSDHVRALVEQLPGFMAGIGRDEDPYQTRLGWWDSISAQADNGWSDDDREFVEAKVLRIADPNVILVEAAVLPAPYERYDQHRKTQGQRKIEHVIADITQTYELAGFEVVEAIAYEQQNLNDPRVIDALAALTAADVAEAEVVAA